MGVARRLEENFDYEIVEEFLNHYTFMVESLDNLIVNLKDEKYYKNNINELFRIFHTIKSASAYLQITPIQKVVTLTEEILEECRMLEGAASEELINWLLCVSDQLNLYKEDLENDHDTFSPTGKELIKVPIDYLR